MTHNVVHGMAASRSLAGYFSSQQTCFSFIYNRTTAHTYITSAMHYSQANRSKVEHFSKQVLSNTAAARSER